MVNDYTKQKTKNLILEYPRASELHEPEFALYPQMVEINTADYYNGRYYLRFTKSHSREEAGQQNKAKVMKIDDLVASLWQKRELAADDKIGIAALIGSTGSGKTTLTRGIARQALSILNNENEGMRIDQQQRMVHYIHLKDIAGDMHMKPSKFLFDGIYKTELEEERAFKWLVEHQMNAVLIFDGFNEATWDVNVESQQKIGKFEKANTWAIMYNILTRDILPHVRIFIASLEFKVFELPVMARPERVYAMNGFTPEDAQRLFTSVIRENGENLWRNIEMLSPQVLQLLSIPVFVYLAAIVMARDPSKPPPTTVTKLYDRIFLCLESVEDLRNHDQILSVINRLKAMAFQGMKEGRDVFKETDLKVFALSAKEVQDLMTKVPGDNLLSRHLMQGNFNFYFCHQSIQEFLAASFVAEMEFGEFCRFNDERLHDSRWSVVRRFVAGIVFLKSPNGLHEGKSFIL